MCARPQLLRSPPSQKPPIWKPLIFGQAPGYPGKNLGISRQQVWFLLVSKDIPNFLAPPLRVEEPQSIWRYPDQKVWVWVPFFFSFAIDSKSRDLCRDGLEGDCFFSKCLQVHPFKCGQANITQSIVSGCCCSFLVTFVLQDKNKPYEANITLEMLIFMLV